MIELFNTLTRRKQKFEPLKQGKIRIYFCGMTVQDSPHVGHLRAFLSGDVLRRFLEYKGFDVSYILNFTDIDDKVIEKSQIEKVDWRQLAQRYENEYFEVERSMNIKPATFYPRATQHILEILQLVKKIEENGLAYEVQGNVWFDVSKFEDYGKLSKKVLSELREGVRIEPDPTKRDPLDFSLWKRAKEGEPSFYSPYGQGRPGWHIECSAMSMKYLGNTFDIHGGGQDLIFPHHENEIAQSEGATGKPFVKYWFHNGPVNLKGEKMSKSTGLFFRVIDILKELSPQALRLYLLQTHYRSPIDFSREHLEEAEKAWDRIQSVLCKGEKIREIKVQNPTCGKFVQEFENHLSRDLSTPQAISTLFNLVHWANDLYEKGDESFPSAKATLLLLLKTLGFEVALASGEDNLTQDLLEIIIDARQRLREEKKFKLSDKIRNRLKGLGIILEDGKRGTSYKFSSPVDRE